MKDIHSLISSCKYEPLSYTIFDQSSQSGSYHPHNICINDPTEQSSRWSSGSHDQSQFITIKLDNPAVACELVFGKFHRSHVCNLKEFKIYGGLDPLDMNELLHKGLTDDNKAETFPIRYTFNELIFPIQYIKIVPLATFGANFNYSIWYVQVKGIQDPDIMSEVYDAYTEYKEMETIRLCLKHFRQKNMMELFQTLKLKTGIEIEHPLLEKLHQSLVIQGDFDQAESIILNSKENKLFDSFVKNAVYSPAWQKLEASNDDGDSPCPRGGHPLCIDTDHEKIYLFGGWDGKIELSDFWCYHIKENRWKLISSDTTKQGGPSPRSCHGICYDPIRKSIYVLGRYKEYCRTSTMTSDVAAYESELYQYFIELDRWVKISDSTQLDNGPPLLYHHEMCIDPISRKLYVLGGRIPTPDAAPSSYSGFYSFDLDKNEWKTLRYDTNHIPVAPPPPPPPPPPPTPPTPTPSLPIDIPTPLRSSSGSFVYSPKPSQTIKAGAGHSMLLDSKNQKIYIFGGQRAKECLNDLQCYSIQNDTITTITHNFSRSFGSELGYTQRAAIDIEKQELYIYFGFFQNKPTSVVRNCFWVYHINQNTWEKVFEKDNHDTTYWNRVKDIEPYPRYSQQMVYNSKTMTYFIFGGHPGDSSNIYKRLDDFWSLKLTKPNSNQVVLRCLYLLRTRRLYEMCAHSNSFNSNQDTLNTLEYLRLHITPIVNYDNKEEVKHFKQLCTHLCLSHNDFLKQCPFPSKSINDIHFSDRTKVFQSLLEFFPTHMKEPNGTLIDAVKIS